MLMPVVLMPAASSCPARIFRMKSRSSPWLPPEYIRSSTRPSVSLLRLRDQAFITLPKDDPELVAVVRDSLEADGVTVFIPIAVLNQFEDADFDFLVPGLLQDKVQALIKSLPKQLRKNFIPVSEFALACVEALNPDKPLFDQLSEQLQRMTGVKVPMNAWQADRIDEHFLMRYCLQQDGVTVACSRSLSQLKEQYASLVYQQFEQQVRLGRVLVVQARV